MASSSPPDVDWRYTWDENGGYGTPAFPFGGSNPGQGYYVPGFEDDYAVPNYGLGYPTWAYGTGYGFGPSQGPGSSFSGQGMNAYPGYGFPGLAQGQPPWTYGPGFPARRRFSRRFQPGGTRGGRPTGPFQGVGPRNYQRSDARIAEDVNDQLAADPFLDATDVEVHIHDGEVTLTGSVADRYQKRRAEDDVDAVAGVIDVHNQLRLRSASQIRRTGALTPKA